MIRTAAPATCAKMQKQLVQTGRLSLDQGAGLCMATVAVVGIVFLLGEGAVLTAQGIPGV
jgi:hypothetical protein